MRVGIFSYDFQPPIGGLGVSVQVLLKAQQAAFPAHEYRVFSASPHGSKGIPALAKIFWRKPGGCPVFSLILQFCIDSLIRRHALDIVHVHAGSGGVWLLRKPSCPLIVTAHHTYKQEADIVYRYRPFTAWRKRLIGRLERRTYMLADKVICVSDDTKEALIQDYGIDPQKLITIDNSIEVNGFHHLVAVHKRGDILLYLGRIEPRKGVWTLLEAFASLAKEFPSLMLRLIGQDRIGPSLQRFVTARGLENRVAILGFVHEPMRAREIAQATVMVAPSLVEGFGLTAAEAMACGTSVVASDCPGLRSTVTDGKTGLLFETQNASACAQAIAKLLRDAALRQRLESAGKEEALKRFMPERQATLTQEVYEQAVRP